ncbi:DUF501 domain-containing protein [Litoribacillus peritrichatus]|uniref:DUF501 domain-containing protein n=1 Tax=Litoribacillus peritrichatus TaxID=718191 RepID=A0ABP7MCM7_9GAMM
MNSSLSPATEQDLKYIEATLGRVPRGILAVSARDPKGLPIALKMKCVVDNTPFPTHFWLCHELLIEKINFLESQRLVKPLEEYIEHNAELKAAFYQDQIRYQSIRNKELSSEDIQFLESIGIYEKFTEGRGIGGIECFHKIRCLHMQVAHHVSDNNQIGQILNDRFNVLDFSESLSDFRTRVKADGLLELSF